MTTTVSKLEVEINLDDKDFRVGIQGATADLAKFKSLIGTTNTQMKRQERHLHSLGASFRHTVVTLGLLREALRTAWAATGGLVTGVIQINAEFERLNVLLQGMSKGTTEIERAADATEQFNQVMALAKSAPFTVKELTNSWVKFKSVGLEPADGSLRALTDAVARFGGTDDIMHRATIAVQQMAGKGVISMEELRQQMGEAVPQALVLLARGMNMTVGEMVDAISKGKVEATSALEKLFTEFRLTFGGASQKLMETFVGSMARLRTVWQLTVNEIGQSSGLFGTVKGALKELIVELENPAIRRFGIDVASSINDGLKVIIEAIRNSAQWWAKYGQGIKAVVAGFAAWRAANIVGQVLALDKALKAAATSTVVFGGATRAMVAGNMLPMVSVIGLVTTRIKAMVLATRAWLATNPVGWIALLVSALAAWSFSQDEATDSTLRGVEAVKKYKEASTELDIALAKNQLTTKRLALEVEKANLAIVEASQAENIKKGLITQAESDRAMATLRSLVRASEIEYESLANIIDDAVNGQMRRSADAAKRELMASVREGLREARNIARAADAEINKRLRDGEINSEQRLAERQQVWEKFQDRQRGYFEDRIREQVDIVHAADLLERNNAERFAAEGWAARRNIARKSLAEIGTLMREQMLQLEADLYTMARENRFVEKAGTEDLKAIQTLMNFINSGKAKLAGMNAQLLDGMKETAKFRALLENAGLSEESWPKDAAMTFQEVIALFEQIDKVGAEIKAKKTMESGLNAIHKVLARTTEEADIFRETFDANLTEVPNKRVRAFRRTIEALRITLVRAGSDLTEFDAVADQALKATQDVAALERMIDLQGQVNDLDTEAIVNARDRFAAEQELADQRFEGFLATIQESEKAKELIEIYEELSKKKREAFENDTPIRALARTWEDVMGQMEQAGANWINDFTDTLVDGMVRGKFAFKDFANAVLEELLKIIIRGMVARAVLDFMTMFSGGGGGGSANPKSIATTGFAKGGIMTSDGEMPLRHYARGGIATKPQIAVYGEGSMNEAYVPLPDGRSIPVSMAGGQQQAPNVEVNVINESGQPLDAEQDGPARFDGEGYVLDVVLRAATRPGNFRDGLKGAVR